MSGNWPLFVCAMLCSALAGRAYISMLVESEPELHDFFPSLSLMLYAMNVDEVMAAHRRTFPQSERHLLFKAYTIFATVFWVLCVYWK